MRVILKIEPRLLAKYGLLAGLGLGLAAAAGGFFLYDRYARWVDRAIMESPWDQAPTVFSAPTVLFPGQPLDQARLIETLEERGYVRSAFLERPPAYRIEAHRPAVTVANKHSWAPPGTRESRQATIILEEGLVAAILAVPSQRPLERFYLAPAILAAQHSGQRRHDSAYAEIPPNLVYAVLAAEDQHFFHHPGVDWQGILRSLFQNVQEGQVVQGGSTITQQLTKNIFLSPRRTLERKLQEALIAVILESRLDKEKLFEIYANQVYLGQYATFSIYGFAQAADVYCHKSLRNLTLAECALLAGMIRSPNQFHPFRHPGEAVRRRNLVLAAMEKEGYLDPAARRLAGSVPLPQPDERLLSGLKAPYFLDYLASLAPDRPARRPASRTPAVYASLNLELQAAADAAVATTLARLRSELATKYPELDTSRLQASLAVLSADSAEVLALVGGSDYRRSPFNRAVHGRRQAGSILKPFIYAYLLDLGRSDPGLGLTASSTVRDQPCAIRYGRRIYRPHNFKGIYHGEATMKFALSRSLNAAPVLFAQRAGFERIAAMVNSLGFASRAVPYPSIALGTVDVTPLEMAAAYSVFLHQGRRLPPRPGNGWLNPPPPPGAGRPIFSAEAAAIVLDMMRETVDRGTAANIRRQGILLPMAGKTGTARDGWFVGLTGNLIICCWVGFDENRELPLAGGESALYVFTALLEAASPRYPIEPLRFTPPARLETRTVCQQSGQLATPRCRQQETDLYFPGTAPRSACQYHR